MMVVQSAGVTSANNKNLCANANFSPGTGQAKARAVPTLSCFAPNQILLGDRSSKQPSYGDVWTNLCAASTRGRPSGGKIRQNQVQKNSQGIVTSVTDF